jgi:hypothetical protein
MEMMAILGDYETIEKSNHDFGCLFRMMPDTTPSQVLTKRKVPNCSSVVLRRRTRK